ncbi:MAG: WXG100 family type VII secretion target [Candidatus Promineifilaceae bacterium]
MNTDIIQAQYDALKTIASTFDNHRESNRAQFVSIMRHVEALRANNWVGEGAEAFFDEVDNTVAPALTRMVSALAEAHDITLKINEVLYAAEEAAAEPLLQPSSPLQLLSPGSSAGQPVPSVQNAVFDGSDAELQVAQFGGSGAAYTGVVVGATRRTPAGAVPRPAIANVPPYEYALMSRAVYKNNRALPAELRANGWKLWHIGNTNFGYQAAVYFNDRTRNVVVAHRGTDEFIGIDGLNGSDLDDDLDIILKSPPEQYLRTKKAVAGIRELMRQENIGHYELTHTGHSFGGALADLHAANSGLRSITFENPGTREIFANMGYMPDPNQHITYQSNPNPINQLNQQTGYIVQVVPRTRSNEFGFIRDTRFHHSIHTVIGGINPATGFPYAHRPIELYQQAEQIPLGLDEISAMGSASSHRSTNYGL